MRQTKSKRKTTNKAEIPISFLVLAAVVVATAVLAIWAYRIDTSNPFTSETGFAKFNSEKEFSDKVSASSYYGYGISTSFNRASGMENVAISDMTTSEGASTPSLGSGAERYSETNVQVSGIDEPDILKTDGNMIYYSSQSFYGGPMIRTSRYPYYVEGKTIAVDAFPIEDLSLKANISGQGQLLLSDNVLIVLAYDKITGYDTSDYEELWHFSLNDSSLITARLYNSKLYLVLTKYVNQYSPCEITPMEGVTVRCTDTYYPTGINTLNTEYFIFEIEPKTGELEKQVSLLAPNAQTTVYVSENNIFVAVSYTKSEYEIYNAFIIENSDIFPSKIVEKVKALATYELSEYSKMTELQTILGEYVNSLSSDDALTMGNRMNDFMVKHKKELQRTRIARIETDSLEIKASGEIPGQLLNQFAMDEFEGNLRTAVTIGGWDASENAVYVLNSDLETIGETEKFGETERIYSARFIGDKAYIVTFRQTDPFFVMDLSNPEKPEIRGELKIPGYSAYLHPIDDSTIIGIGKEGSTVKVSLFDVSDAENPQELDKYVLTEYWSDILSTHTAFLIDKKHEVFFLPGSSGGYIFSYAGNKLELVKSISENNVKRALYINDYMYILTDSKIVVVDENTWQRVKELELN
jgi:inhibitor of cysteine peptidase